MRSLRRASLAGALLVVCSRTYGSPDAWFDGLAGPYQVLVHVQAPPVVPGIATVNVQLTEPGITHVTAFVNRSMRPVARRRPTWRPSPNNPVVVSDATLGDEPGIEQCDRDDQRWPGDGSVVVPLVAVAGRRLEFNRALALPLAVVAVFSR